MKILAVFHPTSFCNLDCTYCWAPDRNNKKQLDVNLAELAIKQIYSKSYVTQVDFLWLTGEPLVMGVSYFESVIKLCNSLKPLNVDITFTVQTNGTLIDERWIEFFKMNDFVVGVSLDGPQHLHDLQRRNKSGKSTFDLTIRGIDLLIRHEVKGGALCVITKNTLDIEPEELFFFFHNKGISWSYLIEAQIGENKANNNSLSKDDLPRLRVFLQRLMSLWGKFPNSFIKDFDYLAKKLFTTENKIPDFDTLACLDILNILPDGSFYWGSPELLSATNQELGFLRDDLFATDIFDIRLKPEFISYQSAIYNGIEKCKQECPYFIGCRGGNPSHKYYEAKRFDITEHLTCQLNDQVISELMLSEMEITYQNEAISK